MTDYAGMVKWDLLAYTYGEGLDIGCGDARPHDWYVGVDLKAGTTQRGPNIIKDGTKLDQVFAPESQDFIFSSHLLNELDDWPTVLAGWWRLIKPNGYLILFMPEHAGAESIKECNPKMAITAMEACRPYQLVECKTNGQQFFHVYRKTDAPPVAQPDPEKVCAVLKLGAHGDALWASSVFPHLKDQGYYVKVYTQETGEEVLRHDPYIDELVKFESRVPMDQLGDLFRWMETKYRHARVLVELVEGTLLPAPQKIQYHFPDAMRHKLMNFNYLDMHHMQARVPMEPRQRFYPNDEEMAWANSIRQTMTDYVVLIQLTGSSVSKHWPYAADLAKKLLKMDDVTVVVTGDDRGLVFEDHPRLHKIFLGWPIRKTMTFAKLANVVVGQETGILNSVAFEEDVRKVVLLTHSTVENLTRDWFNTISLHGNAPCYPCHRLIYGWEFCKQDDTTKAALCQSMISVHDVMQALLPAITPEIRQVAYG